jgi:polyisoprenoid-binding protein YceI
MITSHTRLFALCVALTFSGVTLTACDNEVKGPKAGVAEPVVADDTKTEDAPKADEKKEEAGVPMELTVNKEASKISFIGAKVTGKHDGGFKDFDGKLKLGADGNLEMVAFTVKTDSVYSDAEKLTGHLKAPDFFDTAKFPEAKFESTAITTGSEVKTEDGKAYTHTIVGNMTIRGITKSLTIPAMVDTSGDTVSASSDFVFDRNIFEITYKGKADDLIKPDVKMSVELKAPKKS